MNNIVWHAHAVDKQSRGRIERAKATGDLVYRAVGRANDPGGGAGAGAAAQGKHTICWMGQCAPRPLWRFNR